MFNPRRSGKRYVPLLKTKASELDALKNLGVRHQQTITPLFELHDTKELRDPAALTKFVEKMARSWPNGHPFYIDAAIAVGVTHPALRPSPCQALFNQLVNAGLRVIPVTDPYRDPAYQGAVAQALRTAQNGICIRVQSSWIVSGAPLNLHIPSLCSGFAVQPNQVDILLDLSDITLSPHLVGTLVNWTVAELNALEALGQWREMILAGASFPQVIPQHTTTILSIPRIEWLLWDQVRQDGTLRRAPDFGDYTCHSAIHQPIPVYALANAACKIRYATDDRWLAIKGQSVKSAGAAQYYALAAQVAARPEFCGAHFCFGDGYIADKAIRKGTTGSHRQWLTADINHHLAYVAAQV